MNAIVKAALTGELIEPSQTVRVIGRRHPLAGSRTIREVAAGLSIAEILRECAGEPESFGFVVHLDGHPIEARNFHRIRVKAGVTLTFVPRLGNGGSNPWATVLSAVVAITALIVAPWAAPFVGSALGISAGIAQALVAGGIIAAGTLLANALFPVRPAVSQASTPLNSIQGAQNQANPFGAVPVVLGRSMQSPNYAAKPYTEIVGDDQYLRLLFCLGYGPLSIDTLQIGTTDLATFAGVQTEIRQGLPGDAPITLYPSAVDEQDVQVTLDNFVDGASVNGTGGTWNVLTSSADSDEISVDFTASSGINMVDPNDGSDITWPVSVEMQYSPTGAGAWVEGGQLTFTRNFSPSRLGLNIAVTRGQYDVRCRKLTGAGPPNLSHDTIVWTALRSLKTVAPVSFPKPLALIALRIQATGQLSGTIDTFNCITTSLVTAYSGAGGVWNAVTASQNQADLFRWVLQGPANARPQPDSSIDLPTLQAFWTFCDSNHFKYNEVVNSAGSVQSKLSDICSSARAAQTFNNGQWSVIWDQPDAPIAQFFTRRNSWGFQGTRTYAQQPDGFRVQFINELNGFTQDEIRVYDDGFDASNATVFEQISFTGVTDPTLNYRLGRFQIAQARLRPEQITLQTGWEQLNCTSGDRVAVTHDVLLIGLGAARITALAGQVVTIDETVTIEDGKTYGVIVRLAGEASPLTFAVDVTPAGDYTVLTLVGDLSAIAAELGASGRFSNSVLLGFGETALESAVYRIQGISQASGLVATLTLVDDAPAISQADQGVIPAYNPNITIPPDPRTLPPRNLVYLEVIDGQGTAARALVRLSWQLPRLGAVASFDVQQRDDNAGGPWRTVASVPVPQTTVDVPLTSAGVWSFQVRCVFGDGTVSGWTSLIGLNLQGLSAPPADVTNLHEHTVDGQTVLDWTTVADQRVLFYEVRKGTAWDTSLVVGDSVTQPPWPTTGDGTYHVRAYVLSPFGTRIYSPDDAAIEIQDSIIERNIIVSRDEQATGWTGGLDGGVIDGAFIRTDVGKTIGQPWSTEVVNQLALSGLHLAVYLSSQIVDIGQPNECRFWTLFEADGVKIGADFLAQSLPNQPDGSPTQDVLGVGGTSLIKAFPIWRFADGDANDVFAPSDIFSETDAFSAGIVWGSWAAIASGTQVARYFQPGYVLITSDANTNATGTKFSWFVDVPDREDDYTDLTVTTGGLAVTFYQGGFNTTPAPGAKPLKFNGGPNGATVPHVQCAIVNPTDGDQVVITSLTASGCTVNVVNAGAAVARSGVNLLVRGF